MNHKKYWIFIIISFLLVSCSHDKNNLSETSTNEVKNVNESDAADLDAEVHFDTVDISDVENGKMYQEIKYQVVVYDDASDGLKKSLSALNAENKKNAEDFRKENMQSVREFIDETGIEDGMYSYTEDYTVITNDDKILSLIEFEYTDLMGAHGNYYISGYNFDKETGRKLLLDDFIKDKEKLRVYIKDWIKEQNDDMFFEEADEVVDKYIDGEYELQYYLKNGDLIVIFQIYDLAPYAAGAISISIPQDLRS